MVSKNNYQLYQQKHVDGKQRWGIRKLSVGVASVLLGTTFMLYGNHAVLADTVTSPSDDVTRSTTTQGGNKDKVTEGTTSTPQTSGDSTATEKGQGKTLTETPTGTDKQANDQKVNQQVPTTDTEEKVVATNHQDTPQGQNPTQDKGKQTNANETTLNTTNVDKKDPEVTPKVRATRLRLVMKTASAGSGASGSSATGVVSGSQGSNSQAASTTSSAATDSQATSSTQVTVPAASQSSESANSGNETSSQASQAGTVSANQTSNTSAAGAPASSDQTVTVDETTLPATQAAIPSTNLARLTNFKVGTRQRHSAMLLTNLARLTNSGTDTTLPTTTQTYDKVVQPLLYDYLLHTATGTRDGQTWVDKTVADYPGNTLDTIFGTTSKPGIILSNTDDKYFFAAYVDYSERYHRVILLARSQKPSDKNLYSYTIHTYWQKTSNTTIKPGESIKEQYTGVGGIGGSTHDLIFQNYGDSFTVKLSGFEGGWGLLPVFDSGLLDPTYGSNTLDQNDEAARTKQIGFWANAIPQETSTKVRYVDQATGKDIVQPMEISGFG